MHILLTNDDGIYAPGLRALLPELRKLGPRHGSGPRRPNKVPWVIA